MKMKRKLAAVLAKAFSGKPVPEKKREKEARAIQKAGSVAEGFRNALLLGKAR